MVELELDYSFGSEIRIIIVFILFSGWWWRLLPTLYPSIHRWVCVCSDAGTGVIYCDPQFDIILLGVALLNGSSTEIEKEENCTGGDQLAR